MPFESWLKGTLREVLMDTLSESQVRARGLLKPREVSTVLSDFERGSINWTRPWLLMMIELWAREVLDSSPAALARKRHGQPYEVLSA